MIQKEISDFEHIHNLLVEKCSNEATRKTIAKCFHFSLLRIVMFGLSIVL